MRIAFPLGGSDLGRSGIGICVREVLPRLAAICRETRDELVVIGTRAEHDAYDTAALDVDRHLLPSALDRAGPSALFYLLGSGLLSRSKGADVLLLPAGSRRLALASPIPTVAVVHDLAQLEVADRYGPLRMFYFRRLVVPAFGRATLLVAVSNATRDDLAKALGMPKDEIRVVLNGVDTERFQPADRDDPAVVKTLARHSLERPYLLYVSRLEHPGKNHVRLVRAFGASALARSHDLILVGADWGAHERIVAEAKSAGVADRVRWLGFVEDEDLPNLVAASEAVIMVGLREGFGLPALEAIAAGRPVCASDAGALPEVVGPHAALCDPLSEDSIQRALERVVSDAELRHRVADEGHAWASARGWGQTARGLYEACVSVGDDRHRRTP